MINQKHRSYSELRKIRTFEDRYKYLAIRGDVGRSTFGYDRFLNQQFYTSSQWRNTRNSVIVRDAGCDLGIPDYEIHSRLYIHHMNPMTIKNLLDGDPSVLDPEFLITTTHQTHNAIHYGDDRLLPRQIVPRSAGDTKLWLRQGERQCRELSRWNRKATHSMSPSSILITRSQRPMRRRLRNDDSRTRHKQAR